MNRLEVISDIFCSLMSDESVKPQLIEQAKLVGMTMDDIADVYDFVNEIKEVMDEQADEESDIWPEDWKGKYPYSNNT